MPTTLFRWPESKGVPDRCDQCDGPAPLWSFELAGDEPALCERCLAALHRAVGKVLRDQAKKGA